MPLLPENCYILFRGMCIIMSCVCVLCKHIHLDHSLQYNSYDFGIGEWCPFGFPAWVCLYTARIATVALLYRKKSVTTDGVNVQCWCRLGLYPFLYPRKLKYARRRLLWLFCGSQEIDLLLPFTLIFSCWPAAVVYWRAAVVYWHGTYIIPDAQASVPDTESMRPAHA